MWHPTNTTTLFSTPKAPSNSAIKQKSKDKDIIQLDLNLLVHKE
jgi:hypothetical protein